MYIDENIKVLSATKLIELLQTLPEGSLVHPNRVGNLLIISKEEKTIGYIDFLFEGNLELYEV